MILLNDFYKRKFNCKVYKVALNANCTCPNRDGTKGKGGCIFCSNAGSGDFIFEEESIERQYAKGINLIEKKARGRQQNKDSLYLPYFQSFTSTYGDFNRLKNLYLRALSLNNSCGLAIATRPDCLGERMLELLSEISEKHFLQIELGLQSSSEETGKLINRCYTNSDYEKAVFNIKKYAPSAHIVTHIIFGLPGESARQMLKTVQYVCFVNNRFIDSENHDREFPFDLFGIKITNLYVLKNTVLNTMYQSGSYNCLEREEYFSILEKAIALLPTNVVVHRLTGDPPKKDAVAPLWCLNKKQVLNSLHAMNFYSNAVKSI